MEIEGVRLPFVPIGGIETIKKPTQTTFSKSKSDFQKLFEAELGNLKFSSHARARLTSREIDITNEELEKLQKAISSAQMKGGRESLVVFPDKSFLVSIPNRTIITVFANNQLEEKVITNIDSVVFGY
ncbi:MAG: TIGR02530 family flagellar biosynthesis protein [Candidatus Kapaibacteriota bacterium]